MAVGEYHNVLLSTSRAGQNIPYKVFEIQKYFSKSISNTNMQNTFY